MNPDGRRIGIQGDNNVPDNRSDGDDEFGEFEGFEGVPLEAIPAAAGPSPWATFPDLLPVQTSPASGALVSEDASSAQSQRLQEPPYDVQPWLGGAVGGVPQRSAPVALLQQSVRHQGDGNLSSSPGSAIFQQSSPRIINPPDISLSACPPSLPYSALEAELHGNRNNPQPSLVMASGLQQPSLQEALLLLQEQVSSLQAQKAQVQDRLAQTLQQKQDLATRLSHSHSQTADLRLHLQETQDQLRNQERKTANFNSHSGDDCSVSLNKIQLSLSALLDSRQEEQRRMESLNEQMTELRITMERKVLHVEQEVGERHNATEWRLTQHMTEVGNTIRTTLTAAFEEGFRLHTTSMDKIISESLMNLSSGGAGSSAFSSSHREGSAEALKINFQHCIEQHKQMLEKERGQQTRTVSRVLETVLAQLNSPQAPPTSLNTENGIDEESTSENGTSS